MEPYNSIPARLLRRLSSAVYQHPRWFFYPQAVLFLLCILYTVKNLEFSTNRNDLVGSDKKYHQNYLQFRAEFRGEDDLVAVVESEDHEKNRQFVERLGARLESETNLFADVIYKGDLKMLGPKALLFLPVEQLNGLRTTLADYRPFLQQFSQATNLNSLFRQLNHQFRTAKRETNASNESLIAALPALSRIVEQSTASLRRPGKPPSPGLTALFNAGNEAEAGQYITFADGRIYLVSARALRNDLTGEAVERLRRLVREVQLEVPGVNVGITGEPVLEVDEMAQSQADSTVATLVSLVLVAVIFIVGYREVARPIKATVCLIVGLGYTMGFTTLVVGHLNILTVTFLPILIGLAIDFGVHLITRYEEETRRGAGDRLALERAMVNTGQGIFTGCFTTAGAFLAMGFTDFKGIEEMGIITGGGLLICLVPMMTLLPVLLRGGRRKKGEGKGAKADRRAKLERLWLDRPGTVVAVTLGLSALAFTQFPKVYFDYNLLNMQSRGLPAVEFEHKLIHSGSKSVLFAAVVANSALEAAALEARITNLPTVASVDSLSAFLLGDEPEKLRQIQAIQAALAEIHFAETDPSPANVAELNQTLFFSQSYLGLALNEVKKAGDQALAEQLTRLRTAIEQLRRELANSNQSKTSAKISEFQQALFEDIRETFRALKEQDSSSGLTVADLPATLRNRFIGRSGKHLLQVYPKENVWERAHQEKFVAELRTVDPNVTGTPVQLYEYTSLLRQSYEEAAGYALAAIAVLVMIHFRSFVAVILALLPVGVGVVWMGGLMGLLGVPFNPANIMTLPLVIGIGVTNGIHILNRFHEERTPSILSKSTGKAVIVSGLTTVAGFSSLLLAEHQGIASLGFVMSVGVGACMIAALTFMPATLDLLLRLGWKMKRPSGDNAPSTLGHEELR